MMRKKTLEFYRNKRNADELYRNTACAINVDARTCKCIHEKTGLRISLDDAECKTRAIQKTPWFRDLKMDFKGQWFGWTIDDRFLYSPNGDKFQPHQIMAGFFYCQYESVRLMVNHPEFIAFLQELALLEHSKAVVSISSPFLSQTPPLPFPISETVRRRAHKYNISHTIRPTHKSGGFSHMNMNLIEDITWLIISPSVNNTSSQKL